MSFLATVEYILLCFYSVLWVTVGYLVGKYSR